MPTASRGSTDELEAYGAKDSHGRLGNPPNVRPDALGRHRATATPPENTESCNSNLASLASLGMSKTTMPLTLLPGLICSRKVFDLSRYMAAAPSAEYC